MTTLAIWMAYENPRDYPVKACSAGFDIDADGPKLSASVIIAPNSENVTAAQAFSLLKI